MSTVSRTEGLTAPQLTETQRAVRRPDIVIERSIRNSAETIRDELKELGDDVRRYAISLRVIQTQAKLVATLSAELLERFEKARPFDIQWARNTIEQCRAAGVACFVKQFGAKPIEIIGHGFFSHVPPSKRPGSQEGPVRYLKLKDRKGGDMSEWPADSRVREFPA